MRLLKTRKLSVIDQISNNYVSLKSFEQIVLKKGQMDIDQSCLEAVKSSYDFLIDFSRDKVIYGVNTGFGPMAQHIIPKDQLKELQYNLIRSHASGTGALIDEKLSRATAFARLISLSKGFSGIHPETILKIQELLNKGVHPCIYEHGGVGASGDLVQLSHLALNLIGEGNVWYEGSVQKAKDVFEKADIKPLEIYLREGLALINGTSAMTGIGLVNVIKARKLLDHALHMSALLNEITESYNDHHSAFLNHAKKHTVQQQIAKTMNEILLGSKRIKERYSTNELDLKSQEELKEKLQEYYSIRCVPQILGPVKLAIDNAEKVLLDELNSANDNPIVDKDGGNVYHGGNFHGDFISFEMDKLKIAITKLTMLCERQINFLMNHKINDKLTPFINLGQLGFNFGLQGIQFTATSTTAESQTLSNPMYVHSISTNNDNQDIVSMGTNSALIAQKVIENGFQVMAIGFMSVAQAVDYLKIEEQLSNVTSSTYKDIRSISKVIKEDTPRYEDIKNITEHLKKI